MFTEASRDLFTFPHHYLRVVPVNCVGVMGAGIARQFKERHPHLYQTYRQRALKGSYRPGHLYELQSPYYLATTKDHWRAPSRREWVIAILDQIAAWPQPATVALPPIGCGLGGLPYAWLKAEVEGRFAGHGIIHVALIRPR